MWRTFYNRYEPLFSGDRAMAQTREQNRIERFFTFPNFARSAERCAEEMRWAGLCDVEVESFPADGRTSWSGWQAMKAWDVEAAQLWMTKPHRQLLADWEVKPQHLVMYSGPARVTAELVEWNGDLSACPTNKIPFTRHRINDVFPQMRMLGIEGIISDFIGTLPGVRDSFDLPDDVRWENSALRPDAGKYWGFMISPRNGDMLRSLLREGVVEIEVEIRSRVYEGEFKSATGVIRGAEKPEEEVLFLSHLYEPGANDNASGTGVGLELLHSLNAAIEDGAVPRPRRSIRFLFGWEGFGLYAWAHRHREQLRHIRGGINIDEIGIDQEQGRSVVHLFRPPASNPSCIGHLSEHLCGEILAPSLRWKPVADRAEIINDTILSDPNIDVVLPSLIQYPSRAYHSSADNMEMLNPEVMKKIGVLAATQLYFLADCGPAEARYLARIVVGASQATLSRTELCLLEGNWPFGRGRTESWFAEQFALAANSLSRLSLPDEDVASCREGLAMMLNNWCEKWDATFPVQPPRQADADALARATSLVLVRTTLGTPRAWGSMEMTPAEEKEYREILYKNNLDLLFHRICYWSNGKRSLLEIVDQLEFELNEMLPDAAIARTSSGTLMEGTSTLELDLSAVFLVVDALIRSGYLSAA